MYAELNIDEGELSPAQLEGRLRDKRFEVFDRVCAKFKMSATALARQPAHELAAMVREIVGGKMASNFAGIREQAAEYAGIQ